MNLSNSLLYLSAICFIVAILSSIYFGFFSKLFKNSLSNIKSTLDFSQFIQNLLFPLFSIGGALIIYSTIIEQNVKANRNHFETVYFKNIEYHRDNNKEMSVRSPYNAKIREGRAAFINFNAQIRSIVKLLKENYTKLNDDDASNLAFQMFYIGINGNTSEVLLDQTLNRYKNKISDSLKDSTIKHFISNMITMSDAKKHDSINHFINGYKSKFSSYYNQYFSTIELLHKYAEDEGLSEYDVSYYANLLQQHDGHYEKSLLYMYLKSDSFKNENKVWLKKYIRFTYSDTIENKSIMRNLTTHED